MCIPYQIIKVNKLNKTEKNDIWEIICSADKEFIPSLSSRIDTTKEELNENNNTNKPYNFFAEILMQKFLICKCENKVIGFMNYKENCDLCINDIHECIYVSTIIVNKEYRNNGITKLLYELLMNEYPNMIIATKTWSTNKAHIQILNKLSFDSIKTIKNDRGNEIDTIYFAKLK